MDRQSQAHQQRQRTSNPAAMPSGHRVSQSTQSSARRPREEPDTGGRRGGQRSSGASSPEVGLPLACPYAKHDPIKYSHSHKNKGAGGESYRYRTCTIGYHANLTRLKQHLERHHYPSYCDRCQQALPDKSSLEKHQEKPNCERVAEPPREGWMSKAQFDKIKERVTGTRNQKETWDYWYSILFPREKIPDSPYAEYVTGEDLRNCLKFVSKFLPRLLRNAAEQQFPPTQYGPANFLTNDDIIETELAKIQTQFGKTFGLQHVLPDEEDEDDDDEEEEEDEPMQPQPRTRGMQPATPIAHRPRESYPITTSAVYPQDQTMYIPQPMYDQNMGQPFYPPFDPNYPPPYGGYDPSGYHRQ